MSSIGSKDVSGLSPFSLVMTLIAGVGVATSLWLRRPDWSGFETILFVSDLCCVIAAGSLIAIAMIVRRHSVSERTT